MKIRVNGYIPVAGNCGHKFNVPIGGMNDAFQCPTCGLGDRFTEEQNNAFRQEIADAATVKGVEQVGKALGDSIGRTTRGLKNIHHRPK